MKITVKLFAYYRDGRFSIAAQDWPAETQVGEIVRRLRLPEDTLGIVLVNGRPVELDRILQENDELALFPMVGGG